MNIVKITTKNQKGVINQTLAVLKAGGLVVFPSDTVYGLLADSTNPKAIDKLLSFKDRPVGKAISVFVADHEMAEKYVDINQNAKNVIKNLLPGPFTVICKAKLKNIQPSQPQRVRPFEAKVDNRLLAENGTLGFRIPDYSLINKLVAQFGRPITATSANLSGKPPVHSISALLKTLSSRKKDVLALVIDAGSLPKNNPSTVIDTTTGQLKTLRIGDLLPKTPASLISNSESATQRLARFLLTKFVKKNSGRPLVFLLEGDLGAGKTIFAKGLGKALKVKEEVISPTYIISYEYKIDDPLDLLEKGQGTLIQPSGFDINESCLSITKDNTQPSLTDHKFIHFDLYRIENLEELKEINFLEQIHRGNIYAVEWPTRMSAEIISALKSVAEIIFVRIKTLSKSQREIEWNE